MENANNKKGSFMGLLPLVIFLVVYFAMGIGTGDFGNFPLMIGIFLASGISLFMKSPVAEKKSFTEKMVMFCKGGGDDTLILMVIIYMLAGAFYGVASGMHATDTVTNIGISILPANMILDLFSSAFNGLTPYAGQLLTAGAMAKIAPVTIMPYVWYDILMIIFGVIFIVIGWPKFKGKAAKAN